MYDTAWSLVPFLLVIPLAVVTRQVLPGLAVGLLAGAYMIHRSFLGGIDGFLSYVLKELTIPDNLRLIVFLYGFGAFVGLVRVTGGVAGFARWMEGRVKSIRGAFAVVWLSTFATFMAPDFRIITVAPVIKQVFERLKVPKERVALIIDLTATPFTAIVPIGTAFVGYMVALISSSNRNHAVSQTAFDLFLWSIPLNFFSWAMLAYGLYTTFLRKDSLRHGAAGPKTDAVRDNGVLAASDAAVMTHPAGSSFPSRPRVSSRKTRRADRPVRLTAESKLFMADALGNAEIGAELVPDGIRQRTKPSAGDDFPDPVELVSEHIAPRLLNLAVPLVMLLVLTLFFTWWDGHLHARTFFGALAAANAAKAMLEALLITLVAGIVWYAVQRQPISRTLFGFLAGGNEMMGVIVLLTLVWAVSAVSTDLGFVNYTERAIGRLVPHQLIAPVLFAFGCVISYVIGSSFGTWGMLLPLGFSLAISTHASLPLIAGAVFASGTFGGFASPLSDNTVAMATVMKLPIMEYAKLKLKAAWPVAAVCTLFYALAGWLMPAT
ncbi:sodium:proton antiporter [Alicyclobacillus tolerans]|uniref:Na+/H+ antiporter NhaC family protein n=1 Tax=Alicyclobacillus tolerans TaxID=90970 RepID=UPI001F2A2C48|nr:Na+/H+ antiporter NhaC family protein [Alicyclobacillus tolerans]MCF8567224.1 sodium:proton antiporter [Alicyclobacillus tolerans]